jgi:hypothetical protein
VHPVLLTKVTLIAVQVWYEWAVLEPHTTKLHNAQGHAYSISLDFDSQVRMV